MSPIKLGLNLHNTLEGDVFWRISRWPQWNGTNLAVLNLHVSPMPPTKFQLNLTYCSRADAVSSWPSWQPSWILELNQFSNSKSPCHPNASHQVWAQSDLPLGSRHGLKIQDDHPWAHLGYTLGPSWISEFLRCSDASHQVSAQSNTVWEEISFEDFQDGRHGGHLGYWNEMILAILNLHVAQCLPSSFGSIWLMVWEETSFEELQDGRHGGHLG